MTEDEAKTKWCPMRPPRANEGWADNRCMGSQCMAWRWHLVKYSTGQIDDKITKAEEIINEIGGGYCGLSQFQYGGQP